MQHFCANYTNRLVLSELDPTIYKADAEGVAAFLPSLDALLATEGPSSRALNIFLFLSEHSLDQVTNLLSLLQKGWSHLVFIGGVSTVARTETFGFAPLWGHRARADNEADFDRKARQYCENFAGKITYEQKLVHERTVHVLGIRLLRPGVNRNTVLTFLYRLLNCAAWVEENQDTRLNTPSRLKTATFDAITKLRQRGLPPAPPRETESGEAAPRPARRPRRRVPGGTALNPVPPFAPAGWTPPDEATTLLDSDEDDDDNEEA